MTTLVMHPRVLSRGDSGTPSHPALASIADTFTTYLVVVTGMVIAYLVVITDMVIAYLSLPVRRRL